MCLCIVYVVFFGGAGDKFERQITDKSLIKPKINF